MYSKWLAHRGSEVSVTNCLKLLELHFSLDKMPSELHSCFMKRLDELTQWVIFASLLLLLSGWANSQDVLPPPRATQGGVQVKRFSASSAPEALVYRVFLSELAVTHRTAARLASEGKEAAATKVRYERITDLSAPNHQALLAVAERVQRALEDNRERLLVAQKSAPPPPTPEQLDELNRLIGEWEQIVLAAVTELRFRFGSEAFASFDQRVRQYVAPNLVIVPMARRE